MTQTQTYPHRANGDLHRMWTKAGPVDAALLVDDDVELAVERTESTMGEPAALALFGFAVGTFIVAWPIAQLVPTSTFIATMPPLLLFAGFAQFIGGLFAFRRGNAFAGTAFGVYGANNVVVATFFILQAVGIIPSTPGTPEMRMLGLELLCFGFISLVLCVAALRLNMTFVLVLLALVPGYVLSAIPDLFASVDPVVGQIGGYFLMASAGFAAYAASAMVINSAWQRSVLPLGGLD